MDQKGGDTGVGEETPAGAEDGKYEKRYTAGLGRKEEAETQEKDEEWAAGQAKMEYKGQGKQKKWEAAKREAVARAAKGGSPWQTPPGYRETATLWTRPRMPSGWRSEIGGTTD